ncbi:MAG: cbb3-type cytochrome oxidase assembly protein CcoS [Bacteroidales bacterium]|nr:cbb3-type cytochrome oxidase assembly protein CcoS [Bacteroidales bacterium]
MTSGILTDEILTGDAVTLGLVIGSAILFGLGASIALGWAIQDRQFDNARRDAESIFDADEPVGVVTDTILQPRIRS